MASSSTPNHDYSADTDEIGTGGHVAHAAGNAATAGSIEEPRAARTVVAVPWRGERARNSATLERTAPDSRAEQASSAVVQEEISDATVTSERVEVRLASAGAANTGNAAARGQTIGRYTVLSTFGVGGMGVVFAAHDPELDRRVALKLLTARRASSEGSRLRLIREAQALAKLSHPNVVQIHDAGEHEGQVFMAMELVPGQSLRAWCSGEQRPSWRQIVAAYLDAARGLAAAHASGLIHRDFKPANVLMGDDGRVRVVDFGLAAALERGSANLSSSDSESPPPELCQSGGSSSLSLLNERITVTGAIMGTPAYMAPEQHESADVGPEADQYGFCVSLYESLYGMLPFHKDGLPLRSGRLLACKLREDFAPPPEGSEVPTWVHQIILRGLAADPRARWPSMEALIAALAHDPQVQRRARARMLAVGAVGATLAGMAVFAAMRGTGDDPVRRCQAVQARFAHQWNAAKGKLETALVATGVPYAQATYQRVVVLGDRYVSAWTAMHADVCSDLALAGSPPREVTVRLDCLDTRKRRLEELITVLSEHADRQVVRQAVQAASELPRIEYCADIEALTAIVPLPEQPAARARIAQLDARLDRVDALNLAGQYEDGLALLDTVAADIEATGYAPLRARGLALRVGLEEGAGSYQSAAATMQKALDAAAEARDDELIARLWYLRITLLSARLGRNQDALQLMEPAQIAAKRAHDPRVQVGLLRSISVMLRSQGNYAEAREYIERALALYDQQQPADPLRGALLLQDLAILEEEVGAYGAARVKSEQVLAFREEALGPDHPLIAHSLNGLGVLLITTGEHELARQRLERALAVQERSLGTEHPFTAIILNNLANVQRDLGQVAQARQHYQRALAIRERIMGPDSTDVAATLNSLASLLAKVGEYAEARRAFERAIAITEKNLGAEHPWFAISLYNLGQVLADAAADGEAEPYLRRSLAIMESSLGSEHPHLGAPLTGLGQVLIRTGRHQQAHEHLQRALTLRETRLGPQHPAVAETLVQLGELRLTQKRPDKALPLLERAVAICQARGHGCASPSQFALAKALWSAVPVSPAHRHRALELAHKARAAYVAQGSRVKSAVIEGWIDEH